MDELRWFLLIVGVLAIAGIYGYGRWQEHRRAGGEALPRRRPARRREGFDDSDIDDALRDLDATIGEFDPVEPVSEPLPLEPAAPARSEPPPQREQPARAPQSARQGVEPEPVPEGLEQKVVVIHVASRDSGLYSGEQLVAAMQHAGLQHGEYDIFHAYTPIGGRDVSLFSAANMLEPGWFDIDDIAEMRTPGLALFLQLPGPFDSLAAFEQMLKTARRLAEQLDANLLDARRCNLTQQAIEHIREELREYRRRAHLLARQQKR